MKLKTGIKSGNETGLGDCVAKIATALGLDQVASEYEDLTGKPCGCAKRREMLNRLMPEVI